MSVGSKFEADMGETENNHPQHLRTLLNASSAFDDVVLGESAWSDLTPDLVRDACRALVADLREEEHGDLEALGRAIHLLREHWPDHPLPIEPLPLAWPGEEPVYWIRLTSTPPEQAPSTPQWIEEPPTARVFRDPLRDLPAEGWRPLAHWIAHQVPVQEKLEQLLLLGAVCLAWGRATRLGLTDVAWKAEAAEAGDDRCLFLHLGQTAPAPGPTRLRM